MMRFFFRLFSRLPLWFVQGVGALFGWIAYVGNLNEKKNAIANIRRCFPELSETQQQRLVKTSLKESMKILAELPHAWIRPPEYWLSKTEDRGFREFLQEHQRAGKGVIVAAPHLGNWEAGLVSIASAVPTTALYRPPRQEWIEEIMLAGRVQTGSKAVPTDGKGIKALFAALRRGECVAILPDQTPKKGEAGVRSEFFGHPVLTMTLLSKLAAKTGAAVVVAFAERRPHGAGFRIHYSDVDPAIRDVDLDRSVATLNLAVEKAVRECPEQYQWHYRRFYK